MAKKHFDKYYENYKGYYLTTLNVAEDMKQAALKGEITEERVVKFQQDAEPIIHTFKILQEVKRLIDRPTRSNKRVIFEKQTKRIAELTDKNDLDVIEQKGNEAVQRLKDLVE